MRARVREVEAPAETRDLEEFVAEASPGEERSSEPPTGEPIVSTMADPHALTAHDLGPNGDVVLNLLARAARLTADEARDLVRDATWRWGFLSIAAAVVAPAGTSLPISRALARARARADGRGEAITTLDSAVAAIVRDRPGARSRAILHACIANAGLAVLVRDLIDPETFDVLFGPWREIMHH